MILPGVRIASKRFARGRCRGRGPDLTIAAMHPIESLHIDGDEAELSAFAVPDMSLSSARDGMRAHEFVLTVRAAAMAEFLTSAYEAWVRDSKEDDEKMGGPQDDLALAGYPSLDRLHQTPDILLTVLGSYLLHDFIGKLSWDGSRPIRYWLDKVTRCEVDEVTIRLFGICYSRS